MMNKRHETDCGLLHEDGPEHCTCSLLPCPFCGNEHPAMLRTDAVWCGSCLATMPEHDREAPNAIDRWNTRDACTGFAMSGLSAFEPTEAMWQAAWDASEDYFLSDRATVEGFRIAIRALLTAASASAPAGYAVVEAAFKEGVATGYQCGKADENTTDEWHSAWLASDASVAAALDRPRAAMGEDFLTQLRRVNTDRYQAWVGDGQDAGILFDAAELGGEIGELLNVVKKLEREDRGWRGSRAAPEDFADECADVLICLDKLARRKGVDLAAATVAKFNATSAKVDLPHRLALQSPPAKVEE